MQPSIYFLPMKLLYFIVFFLFTFSGTAQTIRGNITSTESDPLGNISISLEGANRGTRTTENGDFIFRNIRPGIYTLVVSGIGYSATKQNITVVPGRSVFLNLELDKSTLQLQEVTVSSRSNRPRDKASSYAARLPLQNLENPQFVSAVPNQLIVEQAATDQNSIIKNIPGVVKGWSSVAAYYSSRGFNTRNYIRNGVAGYVTGDIDMANTEQLEAVKGPSGTLFGSSLVSFGGLLNRITKKPFDTVRVELGYQAGSYDLNRFTADVNTPLNKEKTALLRVNAAQHYEGSFQNAGFLRSTFVAPSLLYKVTDRLTFSLDAEGYWREGTSQPQITPIGPVQTGSSKAGASNPLQLPLDYKRSYGNNTITLKNPNLSFYGLINYRLSEHWTSQTNLVRTRAENTGNYLTFTLLRGDSLLVRNVSNYPTSLFTISQVQQNFTGDLHLGRVRNRLVAGLDFYQNTSSFSSNALNGRGGRRAFDTLNLKRAMPGYALLSPDAINARLGGLSPTYSISSLYTYALYVSDVINITKALSAMLSLRADRFINRGTTNVVTGITTGKYNQTAFSPKLGLVYQVIPNRLSLFGNYTNGFQNVAPVMQPDGAVSAFAPQYANQFEGGIKTELARDLLGATISYYRINVENTLRPDAARPTFTVQEGTQYSRGVEVDLFSRPVTGLLLHAGFAYNESRLTSADGSLNGLRPVNAGPDKALNFYGSYSLPLIRLSGLGLGFGGNRAGRNLIVNNTANGQFYLHAYTILNAAVFYNRPHYRFGVNIDNLTNQQFYNGGFGTITPGMLRRLIVSMSVRF